jgi:gliding motility-associated-like protein
MKNHHLKSLLTFTIRRNIIIGVFTLFIFVISGVTQANRDHFNNDLFAPSILLVKTGVPLDATGSENGCTIIEYTFTVTNTSTNGEILTGVQLNDPSLGGLVGGPAEGDVNIIGEMDPGETWIYRANYVIQQEDIVNGFVENQANVVANVQGQPGVTVQTLSDDDGDFLVDPDPTVIDLSFCQGGIGLIKTGLAIEDIDAGPGCNFILYTFSVSNEGNQPLQNIQINDPLLNDDEIVFSGGDNNDNSLLDIDEIWQYSAVYVITTEDLILGQVENQATVSAHVENQPDNEVLDESDDDSVLENNPTIIDLSDCQAGIALVKTGLAIEDIDAGAGCNYVLYNFAVTNEGALPLQNVFIEDPLLNGESPLFVAGDNNNNDLLDTNETWSYAAIYDITPTDIVNGEVINQATVTAHVENQPDNEVADDSDDDSILEDEPTVVSLSDCQANFGIALIKTGLAIEDIDAGVGCNFILYTFSVTNISGEILDNVAIADPLLENVPIELVAGDDNDDMLLDPDEVWIYSAIYNIEPSDINNGFVMNQAEVSANILNEPDIILTDLSDDDSLVENDPTTVSLVDCQEPEVGLIKEGVVVDVNEDGCLESILYTFTVTNTGNADLEEITLEDPLFGGEVPGPVDGSDDNDDGILSVGETWTYETLYAITQEDIDNAAVINQATVSGYTYSNVMAQDLSDDDSLLENEPTRTPIPDDACTDGSSIGLIKQGVLIDNNGDGCLESILYTFTVTNNGGIDLDEVTLEDALFEGEISGPLQNTDINNDGILSVDESWTYEAIYAITQEDIDNGAVINQATIIAEPVGFDSQVFDLSDDDNLLENEPTRTPVPEDSCTDGASNIGLIKQGVLVDINNDGCLESILYTFTITNNGAFDLDEVNLEDSLFDNEIPGPINDSDINNDGVLSVGETWTYQALYGLMQEDIDNGTVLNQATVTAQRINYDIEVSDLSDDDSLLENDFTNTAVPNNSCTDGGDDDGLNGIGLIKQATLLDSNNDNCVDTIGFTFTVLNGSIGNIENVVLTDALLGGVISGPTENSDENEDGILSSGETWTYEFSYSLTQTDVDAGVFINQATVVGNLVGFDFQLQDLSDNDAYDEDEPTEIIIPNNACVDGGAIGFQIFNGITPNGDGFNDFFRILGIENYPNNNVKIFNRWGVKVYETDGYGQGNNLFYGISEGRATLQQDRELPSGTYFYILTFTGTENPGEESYTGYLYINRD